MKCPETEDYLEQFKKKMSQQHIPFCGTLDLTHRCNLKCLHCYLGNQRDGRGELSADQWHRIIDEITEAGCLNILITGGEPLLRKDFAEIYAHARSNGMLVTVFTNATLITDEVIDLFQDLPPRMVEITLYGSTAETYEQITGINGSYEQCMQGIQQLLDNHIRMGLKTILMRQNRHEFYEIEALAKRYGVRFRFDAKIFPCLNGNKEPLKLRVCPEEVVEKEFSDVERARRWGEFLQIRPNIMIDKEALYHCGVGLTGFYLDPYGRLQPCMRVKDPQYDVLTGDFLTGWRDVIPRIREKKSDRNCICNQCERILLCGYCPAIFELENGAPTLPSAYICALGSYRLNMINTNSLLGGRS